MAWRRALVGALVLGSLAAWEWSAVTTLGTVYEDAAWRTATETPWARSWQGRPVAVGSWRLLASTSLATQHLANLALHGVNAALVGLVALGLGLSPIGAALAAGVMLLHPLTSEAVAYLSGRAELLAGLGVLTALVCWQRGWWVMGALAALVGIESKETAIVVVVLALALRQSWRRAAVALLALLAWVAWHSASVLMQPPTLGWLVGQLIAEGRVLGALVVPYALTVDYGYAGVSHAWWGLWAAATLTLLALAWSRRLVSLAWIGAVCALRLVIVTPMSVFNEHQAYLAVAGFALAIGAAFDGRVV